MIFYKTLIIVCLRINFEIVSRQNDMANHLAKYICNFRKNCLTIEKNISIILCLKYLEIFIILN